MAHLGLHSEVIDRVESMGLGFCFLLGWSTGGSWGFIDSHFFISHDNSICFYFMDIGVLFSGT